MMSYDVIEAIEWLWSLIKNIKRNEVFIWKKANNYF